jgi:hypothetical protein
MKSLQIEKIRLESKRINLVNIAYQLSYARNIHSGFTPITPFADAPDATDRSPSSPD